MFKFDEQIISHLDKRAKEAILKQKKSKRKEFLPKSRGPLRAEFWTCSLNL
jgi:hypothetical protein